MLLKINVVLGNLPTDLWDLFESIADLFFGVSVFGLHVKNVSLFFPWSIFLAKTMRLPNHV